ncbi:hypothetical protein MAPG_05781 [Magnaporthiopsis poae ATCC 64411]|uniref:BZIP domain-containing protein n=1 Tax=Magnaporthiopsis poae (strain ATCC 64411 / 73-15) TaxID=644358 RepID=A0A0C4E0B2_MAGP6|nr:hypothetical protein MAPG_05781 [Magnaporthiopsis poae ATCC 64411]
MVGQAKEDDTERAARLRDNKRRHRQRKREYVAELEQRLAKAHADGIQATKEVQAAARRVVWENSRLRQILHGQGLSSDAIDALIDRDGPYVPHEPPARKANMQPASIHEAPEQHKVDSDSSGCGRASPSTDSKADEACPDKISADMSPPPCKLLTILAGNPNVDVTQLPPTITGEAGCKEADSVGCLRAREMLMTYATSELKLDDVCRTLEQGCVKNKSGGGCHVKNDVILRTLDRLCE